MCMKQNETLMDRQSRFAIVHGLGLLSTGEHCCDTLPKSDWHLKHDADAKTTWVHDLDIGEKDE